MVGVLIVSHGAMAAEAIKSAELLVGPGEAVAAVGIFPGEDPEEVYARIEKIAGELDSGSGLVALSDLYGGTPNNLVFRLRQRHAIRILAGFNLPMLLYAIAERTPGMTRDELAEKLIAIGAGELREFGGGSHAP